MESEALESRLDELEKENRNLRRSVRMVRLVAIAALLFALISQVIPEGIPNWMKGYGWLTKRKFAIDHACIIPA